MQNGTHGFMGGNGFMGGYGLWTLLGVLLAIFLIVAIVKMVQKKQSAAATAGGLQEPEPPDTCCAGNPGILRDGRTTHPLDQLLALGLLDAERVRGELAACGRCSAEASRCGNGPRVPRQGPIDPPSRCQVRARLAQRNPLAGASELRHLPGALRARGHFAGPHRQPRPDGVEPRPAGFRGVQLVRIAPHPRLWRRGTMHLSRRPLAPW